MTGTLADTAVALLLVSASVVVVTNSSGVSNASPVQSSSAATARTAETLASVTATVRANRTHHGTLAELLAVAARTDTPEFADRVRRVVRGVVGREVRVVARWRVGRTIRGRCVVGPQPPDETSTARLTLPTESGVVTVTVVGWSR